MVSLTIVKKKRKQGIEESLFKDASMNVQVPEEQTANRRRDTAMSLAEEWLTKYSCVQ